MNDSTRRAVAHIAGRLISGNDTSMIYDFAQAQHFFFLGDVSATDVSVYDNQLKCQIMGSTVGSSFTLYHTGDKSHIYLSVDGATFSGSDHKSSQAFHGSVNDHLINLYDHETSQHYNFGL